MLRLGTSHYDCGAATYANAHGKERNGVVVVVVVGLWVLMGWDDSQQMLACVGPLKLHTEVSLNLG